MFLQNPLKYICQSWTVLIVNTCDQNPAMSNECSCFLHLIYHPNLRHTPLLLHLSHSESVLHRLVAVNTQKRPEFASILQRSPATAPFTHLCLNPQCSAVLGNRLASPEGTGRAIRWRGILGGCEHMDAKCELQ